jgi:hypothetical protein
MSKWRIFFMYVGRSVNNVQNPQPLANDETTIAQNGNDVAILFQGTCDQKGSQHFH